MTKVCQATVKAFTAMAVTSRDVAERAGVSQSTVSLVLCGKAAGRVGARTIEAVEVAARELGYRPNVAARTLRTGRTGTLGLVVPDVTNPVFGLLLRGAQRVASEQGYTVALVDLGNRPDARSASVRALQAAAVDGFLMFEVDPDSVRPGWDEPTVAIEAWEGEHPKVRIDVEAGVTALARHLQELGHERIGRLRSLHPAATFAARDAVLAEVVGEMPTELADHVIADACAAGLRLLERDVTAVLCDDDVIAGGFYLAARTAGLRIPHDISVVGFDDVDIASILDPPLTTVAIDSERLGEIAAERLLAEMRGEGGPDEIVTPIELIVRGSTAPPAAPVRA
jgi:LacI family transcriptional regulator, repressor for deo operon, udp, cdd, tsx, nupC, and nupG